MGRRKRNPWLLVFLGAVGSWNRRPLCFYKAFATDFTIYDFTIYDFTIYDLRLHRRPLCFGADFGTPPAVYRDQGGTMR